MAWNYNRKSSKYGAKKVEYNGMVFDSKRECRRYKELEILQQIGAISELRTQVKFVLIPAQREPSSEAYKRGQKKGQPKDGKVIEQECSYYADFDYIEKDGTHVVEDVKGMKTKEYIIKRKLMLYIHGIKIREI